MKLKKKMLKVILASKSKVRKDILNNNNIQCLVEPANIDEDAIKNSLVKEGASPETRVIWFSEFFLMCRAAVTPEIPFPIITMCFILEIFDSADMLKLRT